MPRRNDIQKILVVGSGPIVIGQSAEFDYSGTQACKALKQEGYEVVLVNSNPATIMTDPELADRSIELLSTLMRRNLEAAEKESVPLAEELQACDDFLRFQQLRFRSRMKYRIDSVPEAATILVPTQILQPLVENCVTHGVECSSETTEILIRCRSASQQVVILIANTQRKPSARQGFGTGLQSVEKRLRLLYGTAASLSAACEGGEFRVELKLPIARAADSSLAVARP